jgi:hypothetical protein
MFLKGYGQWSSRIWTSFHRDLDKTGFRKKKKLTDTGFSWNFLGLLDNWFSFGY